MSLLYQRYSKDMKYLDIKNAPKIVEALNVFTTE